MVSSVMNGDLKNLAVFIDRMEEKADKKSCKKSKAYILNSERMPIRALLCRNFKTIFYIIVLSTLALLLYYTAWEITSKGLAGTYNGEYAPFVFLTDCFHSFHSQITICAEIKNKRRP